MLREKNAWLKMETLEIEYAEFVCFPHLPPFCLRPSETGSESVHTDLNDEHNGVRAAPREKREGFNNDNNVAIATGRNMAPYEEFTPIYIIKNLVVKPVRYTDIYLFVYLSSLLFY